MNIVAGVDIGGTNTTVAIVDQTGREFGAVRFSTVPGQGPEKFIRELAAVIERLRHALPADSVLNGIGIASPAANSSEGTIQRSANLAWGTVPIVSMLKQHFDLPIALLNDGDAAALGEMNYGAAIGINNFLVVTLGTGLGAGIVAQGKLVRGEHGAAGELGHMTLVPRGRLCGCGRLGCVESYVSATGLCRTAIELLAHRTSVSPLREIKTSDITSIRIAELAKGGDRLAREAFDITGTYLGCLLANVVAMWDPHTIILTGGLTYAGDLLLVPTRRAFEDHVLHVSRGKARILVSSLNNGRAAVLGASWFVRDMLLEVDETQVQR